MSYLYFLDFDGVICDSIDECYASSYLAYYEYIKKENNVEIVFDKKDEFASYRPFIRSGEDYVLIQYLMDKSIKIKDQADFDSYLENAGKDKMAKYKDIFYKARTYFLENKTEYWMSLNILFPEVKDVLFEMAKADNYLILSTKKAEFIKEILKFNKIAWPLERIHYSGNIRKSVYMEDQMLKYKADKALFVDDQLDHFKDINTDKIECLLAVWGYIKPEWLNMKDIRTMDFAGFNALYKEI